MEKAFQEIVKATKGHKDLLAFLGVLVISAILLSEKLDIGVVLIFAIFMLLAWVGVRWALARIHHQERLQDFKDSAKLESLKVLAKHGTKADIRALIDAMSKDDTDEH